MKKLHIPTARLTIRHLTMSDLSDFHAYRSNPEVTKFQSFEVMTKEQAENFIIENEPKFFGKAGEWVQYGIECNKTKKLIGDCAIKLDQFDTKLASIGITLSAEVQNQGFGREILTAILGFLFDENGVRRVVETTDAENMASVNLLESLGFRQEGYFIENIFFKGKWGSEYQFALLKREWDDLNRH